DHGTLCASAIVAQNKTGVVLGFAPQAKLLSVGNIYAGGFFYDMFTFVGEGYDGTPGTGDEAQVASASFGFSGTFEDGWDFTSLGDPDRSDPRAISKRLILCISKLARQPACKGQLDGISG